MKKWIALLLTLAMLLSLVPTVFAAAPKAEEPPRDIWEIISEIEDQAAHTTRAATTETRAAAYAGAVDQIAEAVTASSDYVSGSLIRNGDHLFWDQKDGTGCGYSPRLRARIRETAIPDANPADYAGVETVSYAVRGGSPGSMNVAAFQPYIGIDSSFTNQYELRCNSIAQALGGVGTTYKTTNATIDNIANALETCAVVIFDSHGDTDYSGYGGDYTSRANTSYICLQSGTGFTSEDQQTVQGPYGSYKHAYYGGGYGNMNYYMADGTAISNHMDENSPNGLLWMAICLGMATDGLQAPLREKGVEVVYGYSQSVTFAGDYAWEGKFWPKMIEGDNVKTAIAYMKQQVGIKDPYSSDHPAWPIVASSEDVYPGHGNVDKAQTVNSTWTLYQQYEITAVSNNPEWGTVTVSGNQITATPKEGYYIKNYEVLTGTATVTQNGNVFTVEASTDCTVQINFAKRTLATIQFSTPDGVSCAPMTAYVDDEIVLPEPTGEPTANGHPYRFLGWAMDPVTDDTVELPTFVKAGGKLTVPEAEVTLYALYSYFVADNGIADDQFVLVTEAPGSWAGEYVITYEGQYGLDASGNVSGASLGGTKGVLDLEALGCTKDETSIHGVTDEMVYVIAPSENGTYTVKMKTRNYYLALSTDTNSLTTYSSSNTNKTRWIITWGANGPMLTNANYTSRYLQYNASSKMFRCYNSPQNPITLYAKADGQTWYTTEPKDKVDCTEHSFGDWVVEKEPTCTENGYRYHICTICGTREGESMEAQGHDYAAVVTAPTCTEGGYTTYTCTRCGDTYTDSETDPLGHDYNDVVTEATCTTAGFTTHTCTRCGDSYTDAETEALGHAWDEGVVVTEPTLTASGFMRFTCTRCEATRDEEIPMLVHDCPCSMFTDMPEYGTIEHAAIDWAYTHAPVQITDGMEEDKFMPDFIVNRGQAVTFLYRAAGEPAVTGTNPFTDLTQDWYKAPITWAFTADPQITDGMSDTTFEPDTSLNRAMMLTFLYRQQGKPTYEATDAFADVPEWYRDAMQWALVNGIITEDTVWNEECPRVDVVVYLFRVYEPEAAAAFD